MKRVYKKQSPLIPILVAILMLIGLILLKPTPTGDVNGDGRINAVDLTMMKRHLVGTYDLDYWDILKGDLNKNGRIDEQDIDLALEKTYVHADR